MLGSNGIECGEGGDEDGESELEVSDLELIVNVVK